MSQISQSFKTLNRRERWTCAAVSGLCSSGLSIGLLALFAGTSPSQWLQPSPDILVAKAQCDSLARRDARQTCTREVVAAALATRRAEVRVAKR